MRLLRRLIHLLHAAPAWQGRRSGAATPLVRAALVGSGATLITLSAAVLLTGRGNGPASAALASPTAARQDAGWTARWWLLATAGVTPSPTATPTPTPSPTPSPAPTTPPAPTPTEAPAPPPAPPQAPVEAPAQPTAPPPAPPPPSPTPAVAMTALEQAMFDDINALRVQNGLPALTPDPALISLARDRSLDMASRNYFSHTTPEGLSVFDLMAQRNIIYAWAGENLARNNYPEEETEGVAFSSLVASPPHHENMLGPHYVRMGVGVAVDADGMFYFTMLFIG